MPDRGSWVTVCAVIALVLGLSLLAAFATYGVNGKNEPSDEALTTNFLSHEARFDELARMLASDHLSAAAKGATGIDLAAVARLDENPARVTLYSGLLRQISVVDFRYFPDSGRLILMPDGQDSLKGPSKFYLYLPHGRPQPLLPYYGADWRVPGIYILTGDRRLGGSWFIHHEMTMEVAVPPY
jgi:hypothetical protein